MSDLGEALLDLQRLTERLRRDCPWDRQQNERTIVPYTLEEAYEVADAALAGDSAKLLDELGDLLFQVYFLALLLAEKGEGDLAAVARGCHEKLVRRHPHVFGEAEAASAGDVRRHWEQIKAGEEGREGIFHHVDEGLPALLYARKLQRRAAAVGFDYASVEQALQDLVQELGELDEAAGVAERPAPESEPDERVQDELGDVLFAAVNVSRRANVDPELALRRAAKRFRTRVERAAELATEEGRAFAELELAEQDSYFDRAKEKEG
ncbi:MAG: nucleoside triphosphate pyrophosphohydrolase [Gaiellaceae bacterium]